MFPPAGCIEKTEAIGCELQGKVKDSVFGERKGAAEVWWSAVRDRRYRNNAADSESVRD